MDEAQSTRFYTVRPDATLRRTFASADQGTLEKIATSHALRRASSFKYAAQRNVAVRNSLLSLGLETLRYIQLDLTVTRFEILNGRGQMQTKALGCVVGKDDPARQLQGFFEDLTEKIWVHSEIDDHFVRSLGNAAHVCIRGLDVGGVDLGSYGLGFFGHNILFRGSV